MTTSAVPPGGVAAGDPRVVALPATRAPAAGPIDDRPVADRSGALGLVPAGALRAAPGKRAQRPPRRSGAYARDMTGRSDAADAPETFRAALASLRSAAVRPEVVLSEAPAPQRLAPYSVALTGDVEVDGEEVATGRLVVLHDPAGHEAWDGTFRVVTFVRADLEPEVAGDPLLAEVGWAWLVEALTGRDLDVQALSGTVTRVSSQGFGGMADRAATAEVEVRASWTPAGADVGPHLLAWADLLCTAAGLPPVPPGVTPMPSRRAPRSR